MSILPQGFSATRIPQRLLDRLLPCACLLCSQHSGNALLCLACEADLPLLPAACCPQCAQPTTHGERCGGCLHHPPSFDRTIAALRYDFPVDRIIQAFKYGHQLAIGRWLATQLGHRLHGQEFSLIVPMPLHAERLKERGFNQAVEIARHLSTSTPMHLDGVQRTRATAPQAERPLKERPHNVRGAFECRDNLQGHHILLVDDVMTSGATLNEAARVLKLHGASSVTAAVAARALKH